MIEIRDEGHGVATLNTNTRPVNGGAGRVRVGLAVNGQLPAAKLIAAIRAGGLFGGKLVALIIRSLCIRRHARNVATVVFFGEFDDDLIVILRGQSQIGFSQGDLVAGLVGFAVTSLPAGKDFSSRDFVGIGLRDGNDIADFKLL